MTEPRKPEQVVHVMEEVTPYHVIRVMEYRWAAQFCKGMRVMDLGCSTGTGSAILAASALEVLGVDVSHAAIETAKKSAMPANVHFKLVVEGQLPFEQESFDVIVALNMIERLYNPKDLLMKMNAILKPGGILIVSTVNRLLRLYFWQKPYNRLHHHEYSPGSFRSLLSKYFPALELYGIKTTGPFFPDPTKDIAARKYRLGIYYPVTNFMRQWLRPLFSMVMPRRFPPLDSPLLRQVSRKVPGQERISVPETDLETACREVSFVKTGLDKSSEILALCRKL